MAQPPQIAILGAGIFVKTQYIPTLAEISHLFNLKAIWSRTEESARGADKIAKELFPKVQCKFGDAGLDEIVQDGSISAVLVVLAAQFQVDLSLRLLKSGKHVLQEKPAASSISEVEAALSAYNSFSTTSKPIWAIAENYRFEPGFWEGKKLMADIGDMVNFQMIVEVPMNDSSPYFSSSWRHNFTGGYILDMGVHFVAVLRMLLWTLTNAMKYVIFKFKVKTHYIDTHPLYASLTGSEVTSVSAMTSNVDTTLPPPDSMSSAIKLENGCHGILVIVVSAKTLKLVTRVVGLKGTLQIDVEKREGKTGYLVTLFMADGKTKDSFFPISGVTEELKAFLVDVSKAIVKKDGNFQAENRLSFVEGARDLAVLDAMLESGKREGALVQVKKF